MSQNINLIEWKLLDEVWGEGGGEMLRMFKGICQHNQGLIKFQVIHEAQEAYEVLDSEIVVGNWRAKRLLKSLLDTEKQRSNLWTSKRQ